MFPPDKLKICCFELLYGHTTVFFGVVETPALCVTDPATVDRFVVAAGLILVAQGTPSHDHIR